MKKWMRMRKLSILLGSCFVLGATIQTNAAVKDKPVEKLQIVTFPNRMVYDVGEDVDLFGMTVKVTFTDGEELIADYRDLTYAGYESNQLGSQLIAAQYGTASVPFTVTVKEGTIRSIQAALKPRDLWIGGTKLKQSDFDVKAILDTGTTETVTDFDFNPKYLNNGRNVITVTHGGFKSMVSVEAKENVCQSIRVEEPGKQEFDTGEAFSWQGLKVIAHYLDGSEDDVTTACHVTGVNTGKAGKYFAEVTYQEKKATYQVTVFGHTFKDLDVSHYYEDGIVYLYFNERSDPLSVSGSDVRYEDNQETGIRTFYVNYKTATYTKDVDIPDEDKKVVGSNHIRVQVPVSLSVKTDTEGNIGYVPKTSLRSNGDSKVKVRVSLSRELPILHGLPATMSMPKDGVTILPMDLEEGKFRPDDGNMSFTFKIKVEVPNE